MFFWGGLDSIQNVFWENKATKIIWCLVCVKRWDLPLPLCLPPSCPGSAGCSLKLAEFIWDDAVCILHLTPKIPARRVLWWPWDFVREAETYRSGVKARWQFILRRRKTRLSEGGWGAGLLGPREPQRGSARSGGAERASSLPGLPASTLWLIPQP